MEQKIKEEILFKAKTFFVKKIVSNHIKNTKKLSDIKEFNSNPFLLKYLSNFVFGDMSPESLAKVLLYPRILGTSINTTFGNQLQFFCSEVLTSFASTTPGIDIEFIDATDGRKKYCQVKAGPTTINNDDVTTIKNHFNSIKNIARTNHLIDFNPMIDCIVGVFYGTENELSGCYKNISKDYPVYIGKEFWYRLTGDEDFYQDLINTFGEVAGEITAIDLDSIIEELAQKIREEI